jgi:hypothetical protein
LKEGDAYRAHAYLGYSNLLKAHVVSIAFYEGGQYLLISDDGSQHFMIGLPVISPNGKWFIATSSGGESGYVPDAAQLWEIIGSTLTKRAEFNFPPAEGWGPRAARWLSNEQITLDGNCFSISINSAKGSVCHKKLLRRSGGNWFLNRIESK